MSERKEFDTEKLADLLAKVTAATGPDRELDVAIECATGAWRPWSLSGGLVVPAGEPDYWVFTEEQANSIIAAYPDRRERRQHFATFGTGFYTDPANPTAVYGQGFASIHKNDKRRYVDPYTASIDASLALVEKMLPGWACGFDAGMKTRLAFVDRHDYADRLGGARFTAKAPSIPLAILAALLTALTHSVENAQ